MNKDLDERLVPNGQYRDAMNIQISTSDSSDVGAIENILGNSLLMTSGDLDAESYCVASVADEKNNALYWLIAGPTYLGLNDTISKDLILQYKDNVVTPVVVDIYRIRTSYGNHDSTASTILVPNGANYNLEIGMVAQFDDAYAQMSYFGNNPITAVSAPDQYGNVTVTLANSFNVPVLSGPSSQMSSFIFSKPNNKKVLNFHPTNLITGINILNDFLFWTDNAYEPKKINIQRCIDGSNGFNVNTKLIVPDRNISISDNILLQEKHVTLIRKAPHTPLLVNPNFFTPIKAESEVDFALDTSTQTDVLVEVGDDFIVAFDNFQNGYQFETGDEIRFLNGPGELPQDHQVRAIVQSKLVGQISGAPQGTNWPANSYGIKIQSVAADTSLNEVLYRVESVPTEDILFAKKFPRFSYRYKYQDGEYSTFAPFTNIIFNANDFDYDAKLAYNKGMQNYIKSLELRNFLPHDLPEDVIQVDLLYKESNSPTIYIVDKIKYNDGDGNLTVNGISSLNNWQANLYNVTSDLIYSVVPSNQLLRPYDNVPRVALAQEITGSRIVFANYLQNYNLDVKPLLESDNEVRYDRSFSNSNLVQYSLEFQDNDTNEVSYLKTDYDYSDYKGLPTLKSIRNYQVGITYLDEYGRETPVFSNSESTFYIPKKQAENKSKIKTKAITPPPVWAKGFKFYVKETANEYYNLAMDRVYRAEDGNLWLAFPSSERNKIDEETFLYLKKQVDSNSVVPEEAKYKVIAIENEAPDFIKTEIKLAGSSSPTETDTLLQTSPPVVGNDYFEIDEDTWIAGNNSKLIDITDKISLSFERNNVFTKSYDVINLSYAASSGINGGGVYRITLDRPIDSDDQWIYPNYPTVLSNNIPDFGNNLSLKVYKHVLENKAEFEGKFFVKINGDSVTEDRLIGAVSSDTQYQVDARMNAYSLIDDNNSSFNFNTTGYAQSSNTGSILAVNGIQKWGKNLDFNNPEDDVVDSEWFIDGAAYAMVHKPSSGARGTGNSIMEHDATDQAGGYGKGIQQETSGQMRWYIELAHSKLKPSFDDQQSFEGTRIGRVASPGTINYADINKNYIWEVGSSSNPNHIGESAIVNGMVEGGKFRFTADTNVDQNGNPIMYTITEVKKIRRYNHTRWGLRDQTKLGPNSYHRIWKTAHTPPSSDQYYLNGSWDNTSYTNYKTLWEAFMRGDNRRIVYRLYLDKDPTTSSSFNPLDVADNNTSIGIEFISPRTSETAPLISDNPAVWETEPKENIDLNIFHEASQVYPTNLDATNNYLYVPKGAILTLPGNTTSLYKDRTNTDVDTVALGWYDPFGNNPGDIIVLSQLIDTQPSANYDPNQILRFTRHDNSYTTLTLADLDAVDYGTYTLTSTEFFYRVNTNVAQNEVALSWYNAFSFSNGVESDRLRDGFNQIKLDKGAVVSTILDTVYKEERRGSGLIFSGIYNSNSGVNSLNQFIQAEKITKDLNPTYGSIQKLFSRNTDLIALCEDKILKILANKDAVFNADGNPQLTANQNVLGQTMPFAGDYGISKNPESFAVDNYRAYFTDKQRGAVLRLSMDGITNISDYGMSDWFGDNLQNYSMLFGSFDADKNDYNLTLRQRHLSLGDKATTVTYSEDVKGWVSFKSFTPENAISVSNNYYTFKDAYIYMHHDESVDRNTFYDNFTPSSVDVLLNIEPGSVKNYQTLNYEGTDSKITMETVPANIFSNEYEGYDRLVSKEGWFVDTIITNKQSGHVNEFIEKEGKWFNYIKGNVLNDSSDIKTSEFSFQGIGRATSVPTAISGCTDSSATNYDPLATVDDGSCAYPTTGCCDPKANNHDPNADICDQTLCTFDDTWNCDTVNGGVILVTDGTGTYSDYAAAVAACPTCIGLAGCTDPNYQEYDPAAVCDDGSCLTLNVYGCTDGTIGAPFHPDVHGFCIDGTAPHPTTGKCDPNNGYALCNYDPLANIDDGNCIMPYFGCIDPSADNYDSCASFTDGSCTYTVSGCTDPAAFNYDPLATVDDGSCCYISGCTNTTAINYDPLACFDDGSCIPTVPGCMDTYAINYYAGADYEDGSCIYAGCTDPASNAYGYIMNAGHPAFSNPSLNTGSQYLTNHTYTFTAPVNIGTGINNGGPYAGTTTTFNTSTTPSTFPTITFNPINGADLCTTINAYGSLLGVW
jgi:hypothetical protein